MTREEKLQKAHQMFDNRNLLTELSWQRKYFRRGYISTREELFNLWIFDECIKALEQEPKSEWEQDHEILKAYSDGVNEVIDKLRDEIKHFMFDVNANSSESDYACNYILDFLDKYQGESEEQDERI